MHTRLVPSFFSEKRRDKLYQGVYSMNINFQAGGRLSAVAALVKNGAYLADIGTDHAYIPIYLANIGRISAAIASDIRPGPLARAEENILSAGLSDKIRTVQTNGLRGLEQYPITDIVIAGMGGLEIISILEDAAFLKQTRPHLILQPMQHIPELRMYLSNGWKTEKETQAEENGKLYQIFSVVYDGIVRPLSETEQLLGRYNIEHKYENSEFFSKLCLRQLALLDEKIAGLEKGKRDASAQKSLRSAIEAELVSLHPNNLN